MSRSIRASARSRLSRDSSASSSVTGRRFSPSVVSWPCRARHTQRSRVLPDMARRLAASGIVTCCSRTSRTACSRNSFVYCCRGICSIPHLQTSDHRVKASTFSSLPQCQSDPTEWTIQSVKGGHLRLVFCGQPTSVLTVINRAAMKPVAGDHRAQVLAIAHTRHGHHVDGLQGPVLECASSLLPRETGYLTLQYCFLYS
jgi:hypothetical protein